ncbi:MAG: 50S ribosomal protein L6 [Armatimonadota bacterium]|nr:50S ribosomal protein L6 [Armatimonadota bacterium]MDR7571128.1 50S ribosomal protein L6 [Armatimonadota bacterium]MDR7614481.1 50S ribosomal protein L6 [Armatimonadota bacterium]
MSRIGRMPVPIPAGVEVQVDGARVRVRGPRGELERTVHPDMRVVVEDGSLVVQRPTDLRHHRALHGLTRALLANMVRGVVEGYTKELELVGTGYRAALQGGKLVLQLGFSHPVEFTPPPGITLEVPVPTRIVVRGIDKELVGQVAAQLRALRPPDPYKGKGIRYAGEILKLKPGKAGRAGGRK